jgi:hypothetical protein
MADSKVDVASQALARLGEPSISSFEEDSDTAEKVNQLYEPTILQLLSSHDWSFATRRKALSEDAAATPVNEWARAFLMPTLRTDRVGKPLSVFNSTRQGAPQIFNYEIQERWLLTNETEIVIEYIFRVPESQWPGYFHSLAIEALAATFALPITENASKEEYHRRTAYGGPSSFGRGGMFRTATEADATGDPTRSLLDDHDPIWSARFGRSF